MFTLVSAALLAINQAAQSVVCSQLQTGTKLDLIDLSVDNRAFVDNFSWPNYSPKQFLVVSPNVLCFRGNHLGNAAFS